MGKEGIGTEGARLCRLFDLREAYETCSISRAACCSLEMRIRTVGHLEATAAQFIASMRHECLGGGGRGKPRYAATVFALPGQS